jgi:hypothetical protein
MGAINYGFSFSIAGTLDVVGIVNKEVLPLLHQAVKGVAKHGAKNWQEAVLKQRGIWSQEKDDYAASITWKMTGDFSAVIESDYKYAADIETGRPARDLKRMLDTSQKVRRTTDGRRFLVIPFQHNTPGNSAHASAMPPGVHGLAKAMKESSITGGGQRPSGHVMHLSPKSGMSPAQKQSPFLSSTATKQASTVEARSYAWGGRLTNGAMKQAGLDAGTRKRYAGMVKMDTSTPGGSKSSSYLTFRIMIEGSKGWVVPSQPGRYIAKKVAEDLRPKAEAAFSAAVTATIK